MLTKSFMQYRLGWLLADTDRQHRRLMEEFASKAPDAVRDQPIIEQLQVYAGLSVLIRDYAKAHGLHIRPHRLKPFGMQDCYVELWHYAMESDTTGLQANVVMFLSSQSVFMNSSRSSLRDRPA